MEALGRRSHTAAGNRYQSASEGRFAWIRSCINAGWRDDQIVRRLEFSPLGRGPVARGSAATSCSTSATALGRRPCLLPQSWTGTTLCGGSWPPATRIFTTPRGGAGGPVLLTARCIGSISTLLSVVLAWLTVSACVRLRRRRVSACLKTVRRSHSRLEARVC